MSAVPKSMSRSIARRPWMSTTISQYVREKTPSKNCAMCLSIRLFYTRLVHLSSMQWLLFVPLTVVACIGIAWFAQLSGGSSTTPTQAFFSAIRPFPLLVVTVANMFFALAAYYGFTATRFAIPVMISIGAVTAFVYSIVFLGAQLTALKVLGIAIAVSGVALMAL